jgi:hypothetical protein
VQHVKSAVVAHQADMTMGPFLATLNNKPQKYYANLMSRTIATSVSSFITCVPFFWIWLKMVHHGHGGLGNGDCVTEIKATRLKLQT